MSPDSKLPIIIVRADDLPADHFGPDGYEGAVIMCPGDLTDECPDAREDRMSDFLGDPLFFRLEHDRIEAQQMIVDLPYFERDTHGTPRSIKETRRAQGRGKKANAMRGWKRK